MIFLLDGRFALIRRHAEEEWNLRRTNLGKLPLPIWWMENPIKKKKGTNENKGAPETKAATGEAQADVSADAQPGAAGPERQAVDDDGGTGRAG